MFGALRRPSFTYSGRSDTDHLRHLVEPHEAALVVGNLDVDVERRGTGTAQLGELADGEVGGDVDRRRAELLERSAVCGFAHGKQHRGLEHEVGRQVTRGAQPAERCEHADVRDEVGADPVGEPAAYLGHALLDAFAAARDASDRAGHQRLAAGVPGTAWPEEERDLDAVRDEPSCASSSSSTSVSIITPEPCETRRTGTPRASASSSTARITAGPSTDGISIR